MEQDNCSNSKMSLESIYCAILNTLNINAFVVDSKLTVVYLNQAAKNYLDGNAALKLINNTLRCVELDLQSSFKKKIDLVCAGAPESGFVLKESEKNITFILPRKMPSVFPAENCELDSSVHGGLVLLIVEDRNSKASQVESFLKEIWGFPPKEAQFVSFLFQGLEVQDAGKKVGWTQQTSRWYSKKVMDKIGVKKRSDMLMQIMENLITYT